MATSRFSRWDGTQQFTPQSADKLFDELLTIPDGVRRRGSGLVEELGRDESRDSRSADEAGYVERDESGQYRVTPKGMRRVENKALEELFDIRRKDHFGKHETEMRGAGQTLLDETKPYEYGDPVSNLNLHETLRNAIHAANGQSTDSDIGR